MSRGLALALSLLLVASACTNRGRAIQLTESTDLAAARACFERGLDWYRFERDAVLCFDYEAPGTWNAEATLIEAIYEHGEVRP